MPYFYLILFLFGLVIGIVFTYAFLRERFRVKLRTWKSDLEDEIKKETLKRSRSVLKGKIGEQLAPLFPSFKYEPADARFVGSPIDYLIFDGYTEVQEKGEIRKIVLVDVKTGKTQALSPIEQKVKDAVKDGRVEWETIELDKEENIG